MLYICIKWREQAARLCIFLQTSLSYPYLIGLRNVVSLSGRQEGRDLVHIVHTKPSSHVCGQVMQKYTRLICFPFTRIARIFNSSDIVGLEVCHFSSQVLYVVDAAAVLLLLTTFAYISS